MSDEAVVQSQEPINIAAMMAKDGQKTDDSPVITLAQDIPAAQGSQPAEAPKANQEKTETVQPEPAPAPPKADPPRQETSVVASQVQQPAPVAEPDWKDLIKKQPEVEILKAVGLDEKMINFLSRWKGGEDLKAYLEAATADYSKMSPEELMRRQLQKEFGSLSPEDFEEVYKMKVTEQYKLDPDLYDEKEVRRGRLLLGIDADKARQAFTKEQQELLFSKPPEPGPTTTELEARASEEQRLKDIESYKGLVNNNEFTKQLISTRLLKIGEGDKAFNLEVTNPNDILDLLYNNTKWSEKLWNADGTPNIRKQLILAAIANDDDAFFSNWAKHYEMLGEKSIAEKIQNSSEPAVGTPARGTVNDSDPISQLARFGTITSG